MTQNSLPYPEIKRLQMIAAQVVAKYGHTYLPIFKRIHLEIEKHLDEEALKAIVLQITLK